MAAPPLLRHRRLLCRRVPLDDVPEEEPARRIVIHRWSTARGQRRRGVRFVCNVEESLERGAPDVSARVQGHRRGRARCRADVGRADLRSQHYDVLHGVCVRDGPSC